MSDTAITWEADLSSAMARAGRERRFILADFAKPH
jgi:hypothetical protein